MDNNSEKSTVVLKKYKSGEFLDFDYPEELDQVMKVLNKLMIE